MPNTPRYNIPLPTDGGDLDVWGNILNDNTLRCFDQYLRYNPASHMTINASGTYASGSLRLYDIGGYPTSWELRHTPSGTFDIWNPSKGNVFTLTSGGDIYRYSTTNVSYGPAGFTYFLDEPNPVGDWISSSTVAFTDVDLSDDGVPKGANAAILKFQLDARAGTVDTYLFVRKNGDSTASGTINMIMSAESSATSSGAGRNRFYMVPCDKDSITEAAFSNSFTATKNNVWVVGYVL